MAKRTITFGIWNDVPIEWIVLKEDDFKILVVSEKLLFSYQFNSNRYNTKWSESSIRSCLNRIFLEAFNSEEKKKIVNVYLEEPNKTKDNVFLLSEAEATNLMTIEDRTRGDIWWLRSPTRSSEEVMNVSSVGSFGYAGYVNSSYYIRPAIYIKK